MNSTSARNAAVVAALTATLCSLAAPMFQDRDILYVEDTGHPHPRAHTHVMEGSPLTVPDGMLWTVTGIGLADASNELTTHTGNSGVRIDLTVNGQRMLTHQVSGFYSSYGPTRPQGSTLAVPPGLTFSAGDVVEPIATVTYGSNTPTSRAIALGFLSEQ